MFETSLTLQHAAERPDLVADAVASALPFVPEALVAEIDPDFADTEALCAEYGIPLEACANAVVVRGVRAGTEKHVVCLTRADRRVDVNGLVRRRLDVRKASFSPMDHAVEASGMEFGGITPVGAPADWRTQGRDLADRARSGAAARDALARRHRRAAARP